MSDKIYKIKELNNKKDKIDYSIYFKKIDTLFSLEKYLDAYQILNNNFKVLVDFNLKEFVNQYLVSLIELKKDNEFNDFYEKIKDLPYKNINQEELIKDIPTMFFNLKNEKEYLQNKANLRLSIKNIYSNLIDQSINKVFIGLNDLKEFESQTDLFSVNTLIAEAFKKRRERDYAKAMLFVQLVTRKYDETLTFTNNSKLFIINPKNYEEKYSEYLKEVSFYLNKIKDEEKNITICEIFNNLFVPYIMMNLPSFFNNDELFNVYLASIVASYTSISQDYLEDNILSSLKYNKKTICKLADKILNLKCF